MKSKDHDIPRRDARLWLDDVRSVHNAASIFRTADGAGASRIYCAGTTPGPIDRFGRKRADFAKVALGAEDSVPWEQVAAADAVEVVRRLKGEGFRVIALEQAQGSVDYREAKASDRTLVVLGNEVSGVSPALLDLADEVAEIPMRGQKESLNVAVAAGVFLFDLLR